MYLSGTRFESKVTPNIYSRITLMCKIHCMSTAKSILTLICHGSDIA
jgi:hypothetical protein